MRLSNISQTCSMGFNSEFSQVWAGYRFRSLQGTGGRPLQWVVWNCHGVIGMHALWDSSPDFRRYG